MSSIFSSYESHHSILISIAATIVDALEYYDLDWRPIIIEAGFDPDHEYLPEQRVSITKIKKLLDLSVQYSNDPCFGLTYASHLQPSSLQGVAFRQQITYYLKTL